MVAVSVDAARAAREEAQRLRLDSRGLRAAVQQNLRLATAGKERAEAEAEAVAAAYAGHAAPIASPWSKLFWLRADDELSRVLVPVD